MMNTKNLIAKIALPAVFGIILATGPALADGWGTVKGRIVWAGGAVPVPKAIDDVNKNQDKEHCLSKGPLLSEDWIVSKDSKGIKNVFVWLAVDPDSGQKELPIHPSLKELKQKELVMDQPCCMFEPRARVVRKGQELVMKNTAPKSHNINWIGLPPNSSGNQIIPPGKSYTLSGLQPQRLPMTIKCDIHGWMRAYLLLVDHPYAEVTDKDGNFEIKNAPAGRYRLKIWHEQIGWLGGAAGKDGRVVRIKADGTLDLKNIDMKP